MPGYTYGDTDVLRNKIGVTDLDKLGVVEAELSQARIRELLMEPRHHRGFDAAHLKAIHRHIFQDIYEWAGRTRDEKVRLADGTVASEPVMRKPGGKPFTAGPEIQRALRGLAATLRKSGFLRGLPRREFAAQAADRMAELNAIHPFREGNGRTQRLFMMGLAQSAGHALDFSVVSAERMARASIAAHERGDGAMMRRLFDDISDPPRTAALREAIDFLEAQRFPWNDHYLATTEPGYRVNVTMAGRNGRHFMARTGGEILIGQARDLPAETIARGAVLDLSPSAWGCAG